MDFIKYPKYDNLTELLISKANHDILYVAQEKIHGANLQLAFYGDDMILGKRSGVCDDSFYNAKYPLSMKELDYRWVARIAKNQHRDTEAVILYCEICGGFYHGKRIIASQIPVQTEVQYSLYNKIVCYDIAVLIEGVWHFLPPAKVYSICAASGVPVTSVEHVGTLTDVIDYCKEHLVEDSRMAKILGEDKLNTPNIKEGYMIKAAHMMPMQYRPAYKIKNVWAKEQRVHKEGKAPKAINEEILNMDHTNRFNAVVSKHTA